MPWPTVCLGNDRTRCPSEWAFLSVGQMTKCAMETTLTDRCGAPLDLTQYGAIHLVTRAQYGEAHFYFDKVCEKLAGQGGVRATFLPSDLALPGIFLAQFDLHAPTGTDVVAFIRCYFEVVESLDHQRGGPRGISMAEVRMAIYDRCSSDNFLLDQVEFSDSQIAWAIRRGVDMWNEIPPPVGCFRVDNFPYRYYHVNCAAGELMRMAARNYMRNTLQYSASNLQVADKQKAEEYEKIGKDLIEEYKGWLLLEKRRINCGLAMGNTSIPAYGPQRYYMR